MRVVTDNNKHLKLALVGLIALLWLSLSGFALYSLQTADQQIFDARLLSERDGFSADETAQFFSELAEGYDQPTLIFPLDPHCPCSEAALEHLVSVAPALHSTNTRVLLVIPEETQQQGEQLSQNLRDSNKLQVDVTALPRTTTMIPSSPAAVVLNDTNELVYFGPWSSGGACVTGIGGFVESALKSLGEATKHPITQSATRSVPQPVFNRAAVGCYCHWGAQQDQAV